MALNSKTTLSLIDAICEGPIDGIVDLRKGVFLNETRVTDEQVNSGRVFVAQRIGADIQGPVTEKSLQKSARIAKEVGKQIGRNYEETTDENDEVVSRDYGAGQVIEDITDEQADFVKLVFTVPKLFCVAPEGLARGQLFSAQIKLRIRLQHANGFDEIPIVAENVIDGNVIKGISTSPYQFETQEIDLKKAKYPWRIKVEKLTFKNPEDAFEISYQDLEDLPQNTPLADKRADTIVWTLVICSIWYWAMWYV